MGRKFVVDEADMLELLEALIRVNMLDKDGVDTWYGDSFYETIQDFYPELIYTEDIQNNAIGIPECAQAILDAGRYLEIDNNPLEKLVEAFNTLSQTSANF